MWRLFCRLCLKYDMYDRGDAQLTLPELCLDAGYVVTRAEQNGYVHGVSDAAGDGGYKSAMTIDRAVGSVTDACIIARYVMR